MKEELEKLSKEEILDYICNLLIENEDDASVDYKAIAFFFWKNGMAVGEEPALASFTYAPGGVWEDEGLDRGGVEGG